MRKHRLFGVVIAVLLGAGLLALRPTAPHHAAGAPAGNQLAHASLTSNTNDIVHSEALTVHDTSVADSDPLLALSSYMKPLPPAPRAPADAPAPAGGPWLALRRCESGDDYREDTGNGYFGAYQFALATWESLGLSGLPSNAPPAVQDAAAQRLQARSGWRQWPVCSRLLGL